MVSALRLSARRVSLLQTSDLHSVPPDEFNLAFHGPSPLSIRRAESDRQISHLVIEEGFDGIEVGFCYECGTLNRPCSRISKVAEEVNDASGLGACRNVGPDRRGGRRRAAACQF